MSAEQLPIESVNPSSSETGTRFRNGDNLGFRVGPLSQQEEIDSALAATYQAADQSSPEQVRPKLEYTLLPHEKIRKMGMKVVFGLRKPEAEHHIDLFNDDVPAAPYIHTAPDTPASDYIAKSWNVAEQAPSSVDTVAIDPEDDSLNRAA